VPPLAWRSARRCFARRADAYRSLIEQLASLADGLVAADHRKTLDERAASASPGLVT